jgi:hypothetical protein
MTKKIKEGEAILKMTRTWACLCQPYYYRVAALKIRKEEERKQMG